MGLLERSEELDDIRASAQAVAAGEGRAVVVEGPAGIGKTELLAAARAEAAGAGLTPLTARGTELERAFGFGVVRQLFEPVAQDEALFEGAARRAAALLDVELDEPAYLPFGPEGSFAALHGLYRLTANLAEREPLALLVDDAHWADGASLRFMAYLANRLDRVRVLLVIAARPLGEPGGAAVAELLTESTPALLRPEALTEDASAALVRAAVPDAPPSLCRTCHELTGGNPFFLHELAGALGEAGAGDVLGVAPEGVVASVRARLARFPPAAQELAGAAAIAGDGALIRHAAALTDLDDGQAAEAADALRAGRILADARELRFVHPIIRSAVYEQLTPAARSAGHARAASLLAAEDAPAERIAAHLLSTEPRGSEWVCDRLRHAAREAIPRGAPDASVTYLRRALEEPPWPESRPATLLELGLAESLTLQREPAIEHLRRGIETTEDTVARLYAARTLGAMVGMQDPMEAAGIEERALAASPDADPALAVHIEAHMLSMARFAVDSRRAMFERAARMRERVEDGELDGGLELTVAAMEVAMAGESAAHAADLAERAVAALRGDPILIVVIGFAVHNMMVADRLEDADRILTEAIDEARRQQANYRVGPLLVFRSETRFRTGALADAAADAEAARASYSHAGRLSVLGSATELVQALTEQGRYEEAEAALAAADADGPLEAIGEAYTGTMVLNARARLRLAQGDARAALADLVAVGRRQAAMREPNPATLDWRSRTAFAYDALDRRPAALALAREELELAIAGARPRREQLSGFEALTANERRVAAMAAGGRSNREIAQALYVSHKTVEKHLTAAYRKLGVGGRDELAAALAQE